MSITKLLSELAIDTESVSLTNDALHAAKKMLLDSLAVAIAGWNAPGVEQVVKQMREWEGKKEADIILYGGKIPACNAAFANAVLIHALDYDDIHIPSSLHIMSCVLPVCLATGQKVKASGRQFLEALVIGVEVAAKLGLAYGKCRKGYQGSGFLPTSIVGGFGATAAAARLMKADVKTTVNALGINYAQASGNRQALFDMTLTKRLQPAFAARSATWAIELALGGITGPSEAIEGKAGLFHVYLNSEPPSPDEFKELLNRKGHWEIERDSVKKFTSCGASHPIAELALEIADELDLKAEDISKVEINIGRGGLVNDPFEIGENPQVNAQFSIDYHIALALLRRRITLREFTERQILEDREVADFSNAIIHNPEMNDIPVGKRINDDFPAHSDTVQALRLYLKSGKTITRWRTGRETFAPDKFTYEKVIAKFRECAEFSGICNQECQSRILESIQKIERLRDINSFVEKCLLFKI